MSRDDYRLPGRIRADASTARAARAQRLSTVRQMLADADAVPRAILVEPDAHPDVVVVAVAIRGVGTAELSIERDVYSEERMLELLRNHEAAA